MTRTPLIRRWIVASSLATTLMASGLAQAAGTLRTVPSQLDKSEATKYGEGKRAYDKGSYAAAGKTFEGLLGRVPESPANRSIRASLVLDTMAAYQAAYESGGDVAMLRAGMDAYYDYFRAYRDAHASTNIPEPVVEARFVMKEALGHAEAAGTRNNGTTNNGTTNDGSPSDTTPTDAPNNAPNNATPSNGNNARGDSRGSRSGSTDDVSKSGTTMVATGAVLIALGVGATAMIGIGAVEGKRARSDQKLMGYSDEQRTDIDRRGRSMNTLLIVGAVTAPLLAITGVSLVVVGATQKRKAELAIAPSLTTKFAGVMLRGRF